MRDIFYVLGVVNLYVMLSCTGHTPSQTVQTSKAPIVAPAQLITSQNIGPIFTGQEIPQTIFPEAEQGAGLHHYWDRGYYEQSGLRVIYLDMMDLILMVTPNQKVYQMLAGPSYQTAQGIRLETTLKKLKRSYVDLVLEKSLLPQSWLYRPDRVLVKEEMLANLWGSDQKDKKKLQCAASTKSLPHVRFYFETCEKAQKGGGIEAIVVTHPDDTDLQPIDPIVDLKVVPPCPNPRTDDPDALYKKGRRIMNEGRMGDYRRTDAVKKGLPLIRDAALSGSKEASGLYVSLLFNYIHQDVIGDPLNRFMRQGAAESVLFGLMNLLRSKTKLSPESCEGVLLNFEQPLTADVFRNPVNEDDEGGVCGPGFYMWNYFDYKTMEALRQQARAWSHCWPVLAPDRAQSN